MHIHTPLSHEDEFACGVLEFVFISSPQEGRSGHEEGGQASGDSSLQDHTTPNQHKDLMRESGSVLTPLDRVEQAARQVAESTGAAVQRLARESPATKSSLMDSPRDKLLSRPMKTSLPTRQPFSGVHRPVSLDNLSSLSPLQMAQYTAEKIAMSTGRAVRTLTLDFTSRTLQNDQHSPEVHTQYDGAGQGLVKTSSEPTLADQRTYIQRFDSPGVSGLTHSHTNHSSQSPAPSHMDSSDSLSASLEESPSHKVGRKGDINQSSDIYFPEGYSSLEKVTHTAERVSSSTGAAVGKLIHSQIITQPTAVTCKY